MRCAGVRGAAVADGRSGESQCVCALERRLVTKAAAPPPGTPSGLAGRRWVGRGEPTAVYARGVPSSPSSRRRLAPSSQGEGSVGRGSRPSARRKQGQARLHRAICRLNSCRPLVGLDQTALGGSRDSHNALPRLWRRRRLRNDEGGGRRATSWHRSLLRQMPRMGREVLTRSARQVGVSRRANLS